MPRRKKTTPGCRLYSWAPERRASKACLRHFIEKALEWRETIHTLDQWRARSCAYMVDKAEADKSVSIKTLARRDVEYARLRAWMGLNTSSAYSPLGYPHDRPAYEQWRALNPDCPLPDLRA